MGIMCEVICIFDKMVFSGHSRWLDAWQGSMGGVQKDGKKAE